MATILEKAQSIIYGDRNDSYGPFDVEARKLADMWSSYLGFKISAEDVPAMMIILKLTRLSNDNCHYDSWLDIAGYAGCAGKLQNIYDANECTTQDQDKLQDAVTESWKLAY